MRRKAFTGAAKQHFGAYLIELYYDPGRHQQAYDRYEKAVKLYPGYWKLRFWDGWISTALKQYDWALTLYAKAGELGTDFHDETEKMALCYKAMGEYDKAHACLCR